jgi:tRNA A-37 threonylcarbamoyl transferase component Bud32/HAMP domain-containing protein
MKIIPHEKGASVNLKQRFLSWSALILVGGAILLSALSYWNTRRLLVNEAMDKSEVILQGVESIRFYVKDELRPKMYEHHGADTFIIEAMSTTYISTTIMNRFAESMPNYVYRRASLNPHNPKNMADEFEEKMFDWFEDDPGRSFWQGVVKKNGDSFFISMVPDYFAPACIRCHGNAEDAPQSLIDRYGSKGGFRFKEGDLAGINSIAVPVSAPLRSAWQGSLILFFIILGSSLAILWLINFVFQRLVIERLTTMLTLVNDREDDDRRPAGPGDEIDHLQASVGSLNRYVRSARKGGALAPNFIGKYAVSRPIAAGAMSWLYEGYQVKTRNSVLLKYGFDEVLQNPLYRACLEMEFTLFETLSHKALPRVVERFNDVLVFEDVKGENLFSTLGKVPMKTEQVLHLFSQLCDLTAFLHAAGIVHHDLRPHILMLDQQKSLHLMDMGLAASDRKVDPIAVAGLTPQGDLNYMAPEQGRGMRGDPRSDIYTLGVILFQAVTGKLPFSEESESIEGGMQAKRKVIAPQSFRPDLPAPLEQVILTALNYDIHHRYQWVEDFWEDLEKAG